MPGILGTDILAVLKVVVYTSKGEVPPMQQLFQEAPSKYLPTAAPPQVIWLLQRVHLPPQSSECPVDSGPTLFAKDLPTAFMPDPVCQKESPRSEVC